MQRELASRLEQTCLAGPQSQEKCRRSSSFATRKALARKEELLLSLLMLSFATLTMMKPKRRIPHNKRMSKRRGGRSLMDVRKGRGRKWYIQTARRGWWSK
jgi:hypothetical protein